MSTTHGKHPGFDDELRRFFGRLAYTLAFFAAIVATGTFGYRVIAPGTSWIDALYMTVITLTTVGYGEIVDLSNNPAGRVFTMALLFIGFVTLGYLVSIVTALVVEGHLNNLFWKRRMQQTIAHMSGHYIVCGSSEAAVHASEELVTVGRGTVIVTENREVLERLRARLPRVAFVIGDPTSEAALVQAGIERAAGVIVATENDRDNIVISLTAHQANPNARIVAQATARESEPKLRRVGASAVVSPSLIGGLRIASEMIRPAAVTFLDQMLRDRNVNLRVDEVRIPGGSTLVGKRIGDVSTPGSHALLLAYRQTDGSWSYNPASDQAIEADSTLIFMGTPDDLETVRHVAANGSGTPA